MRRITAREFQKTFQKQSEPVLVGDGVWFPQVTAELMALAEPEAFVGTPTKKTEPPKPFVSLSKEAQVKGRTRG